MGTIFINNEEKNLIKLSFDIVSLIYYYLENSKTEINSFVNSSKNTIKNYVFINPNIPDIKDIRSNIVSNFLRDLGNYSTDINNADSIFLNKFITTLENHKCYIGLMRFYDSLPRVDAAFANLEIVNDFIDDLKDVKMEHLYFIYQAIKNDLDYISETNEFDFSETINAIFYTKKDENIESLNINM